MPDIIITARIESQIRVTRIQQQITLLPWGPFKRYVTGLGGGGSYFAEVGHWPVLVAENGNVA